MRSAGIGPGAKLHGLCPESRHVIQSLLQFQGAKHHAKNAKLHTSIGLLQASLSGPRCRDNPNQPAMLPPNIPKDHDAFRRYSNLRHDMSSDELIVLEYLKRFPNTFTNASQIC